MRRPCPRMQAVQPTPANCTAYRCGLHGLQVWAINLSPLKVSIRPRPYFSPSYNKVKSQTKHVWLLTLFIFLVYPFQLNGSKSA